MAQTSPLYSFVRSLLISECRRCGTCCGLFVFSGVSITSEEWDSLEPEIESLHLPLNIFEECKNRRTLPTIGETPPKKCVFLGSNNKCLMYAKRPSKCSEYPIMIKEDMDIVYLHISADCPRGKEIVTTISERINELTLNKRLKVLFRSFFENSLCRYYDEEL